MDRVTERVRGRGSAGSGMAGESGRGARTSASVARGMRMEQPRLATPYEKVIARLIARLIA
eukprot:4612302-Prymnesium_polylepis.1